MCQLTPSPPLLPEPILDLHRDRAIPFGDSASGDYVTYAKIAATSAFIHEYPTQLQLAILQAMLEDTYIDNGGVKACSVEELSLLQD